MSHSSSKWFWGMIVLLGASSYGVLSSIIKMAYNAGFNEVQVSVTQLVFGALLLWVLVLFRPRYWRMLRGISWTKLAIVGFAGVLMTTVFINVSLIYLSPSLSIVLLFQFTWITILIELLLFRKKPTLFQVLSVGVVLCGTFFAVGMLGEEFTTIGLPGLLFGLCSAITYSIFLVFSGRVEPDLHPVVKSAVMMTPLLPVTVLIVVLISPGEPYWDSNVLSLWGWGIWLGLMGHVIPTICFNAGIPRIGSTLAAVIGSAELPAAVIAAWLLLGDEVALVKWLGIVLIVIGIIISEIKITQRSA